MFERLIEQIAIAVGYVALSAFVVSIYTYMVAPFVAVFGALAIADVTRIKRKWKILIVAVPTIYFGGGLILGYLLMIWMTLPF